MGGKCCEKKTESQHFLDSVYFQQNPRNVGTPLCATSSYVLEPGFWLWLPDMLWHYILHQMNIFKDFDPKTSPGDLVMPDPFG